jgi:hypothetical protein
MTLRNLVAFVVVLALAATATAADKKAKKKAGKPVKGVLVAVSKDKDTTTLTVKLGTRKQPSNEEKKYQLADKVKVETITGKKGEKQTKAGTLEDLQSGRKVRLRVKGGKVEEVAVKKKKKGN